MVRSRVRRFALAIVLGGFAGRATAQVPLDGYFPLVGLALSNEFDEDFNFFPFPEFGVSPSRLLGPVGSPHYDLALLDTGAGFSLLTDQAFDDFRLAAPFPGESDGFRGTEFVTVGGATGQLAAPINDPLGLYVGGLQERVGAGASLALNPAILSGQTNTATITFPPESDLPNVVGLPFASRYATRIRSDAPQVFELAGKTVRTPSIDFLTLGSGGNGITRKAPLLLNPGSSFPAVTDPVATGPVYLPNILNFDINNPEENPTAPTLTPGGLFVNVRAENNGGDLGGTTEFFFDTGASVTVVSQLNALNLGFDVLLDEPEFTVSIVGSGGLLSDIPGFFVEEFTIVALGGNVVAHNVPVIVLDVADPSDPGNTVAGIVGTNLLAGRNVVIDPNPSLGAGGQSAGLYISDPVTTDYNWTASAPSAAWGVGASWSAAAAPGLLSVTRLAPTGAGAQTATVTGAQQAWSIDVTGGAAGKGMTIAIPAGASLTTFSGTTIGAGAVIDLAGGVLDTQYVDVRAGRLEGSGQVRTGSGPIDGQVESVGGVVAPDGLLAIDGRLVLGAGATLEFDLFGPSAAANDRLDVSGTVAIDGRLTVALRYTPAAGDAFDLVTHGGAAGAFDVLDLPAAYRWQVGYDADTLRLSVIGLNGDFNSDGRVDAADYTVWRDGFGVTYVAADYAVWRSNYGSRLAPSAVSVPEPVGAALLLAVAALSPRRVCPGSSATLR